MYRRPVLAIVITALGGTAGCVTDRPAEPESQNSGENTGSGTAAESVSERFAHEPSRPECEKYAETIEISMGDKTETAETAATIPYPDPPSEFTEDTMLEYLKKFDEAYVTQDTLCGRGGSGAILSIGYSIDEHKMLNWHNNVITVFLRRAAGAISGTSGEGEVWEADLGYSSVVYAIDETGIARTEVDGPVTNEDAIESQVPDPLEDGTLVATFE